ncbi:hypothetical protein FRB98_001334 [Tulasnella sp. 332]|nr:hypothetical protein FRB98_001334 [Tulasnella sp. 332]
MHDMDSITSALHQSTSEGLQAIYRKEIEAVYHQENGFAQAALGQANRAVKRRQDLYTLINQADEIEKQLQSARAEHQNVKETLDAANRQAELANQRQQVARAKVESLRSALSLWEAYARQANGGGPTTSTQP